MSEATATFESCTATAPGASEGSMTFEANEGPTDRLVRIVLGVVLLNIAAVTTGPLFCVVLVVGLVGFVSGLMAFSPTYALLRISTLPMSASDAEAGGR